jgi:hypothetical protein
VHSPQGVAVGPFSQFNALARIRAAEVFPTLEGQKIDRHERSAASERILQSSNDKLLPCKGFEVSGSFSGRSYFIRHDCTV